MTKTVLKLRFYEVLYKIIHAFSPLTYHYFLNNHLYDAHYWLSIFVRYEYYRYRTPTSYHKYVINLIKYILCSYPPLVKKIYQIHGEEIWYTLYNTCKRERVAKFKVIRLSTLYSYFLFFYKELSPEFLEKIIISLYECAELIDDDYNNYVSVINQTLEKRFSNQPEILNKIKAQILLNKLKNNNQFLS